MVAGPSGYSRAGGSVMGSREVSMSLDDLQPSTGGVIRTPPDDWPVLRVSGEIDMAAGPRLGAAVVASAGATGVALDMSDVTMLSAAGFRGLADAAAELADDGRRLLLAACRQRVVAVLRQVGAAGVVDMFDSVEDAVADLAARPDAGVTELARARARARALPGVLQTRPVIEGATEVIRRRYDLPSTDAAFAVLREASQRYNLKLRTMAAALLTVRPPEPDSVVWFAGRRRRPVPPVTFTTARREWRDSRSAFLSDVLDSALACVHTDRGNVHLVDPIVGGLRLELHRALPAAFVGQFAHVPGGRVACGEALRQRTRVLVPDVRRSPAYADPGTRTAMQAADARTVQSTPLLSQDGHCRGVVSTLHARPDWQPSTRECAELDVIGRDAGRWLVWHWHTIVLDALEHVHQSARRQS